MNLYVYRQPVGNVQKLLTSGQNLRMEKVADDRKYVLYKEQENIMDLYNFAALCSGKSLQVNSQLPTSFRWNYNLIICSHQVPGSISSAFTSRIQLYPFSKRKLNFSTMSRTFIKSTMFWVSLPWIESLNWPHRTWSGQRSWGLQQMSDIPQPEHQRPVGSRKDLIWPFQGFHAEFKVSLA